MKKNHPTMWYVKKWSVDIGIDIFGGVLIALATYNFAAASAFPVVGLNGIALILYLYGDCPLVR